MKKIHAALPGKLTPMSTIKKKNYRKGSAPPPGPPPNHDLLPLINSSNDFAFECNQIIRDSTAINSVYSPFFIRSLLGMLRIGAVNLSALEIDRGLKLFTTDSSMGHVNMNAFAQLLGKLKLSLAEKNQNGNSLTTAERIYIAKGFEISSKFNSTLKSLFQTEIQQLDFNINNNESIEPTQRINLWFEEATSRKIPKMIDDSNSSLLNGPHSRIVLLNAIHFSGEWLTKFPQGQTRKDIFHVSETKDVEVDMMMRKCPTLFTELPEINSQAIALPFMGDQFFMVIICSKLTTPGKKTTGIKSINDFLKKGKKDINNNSSKYNPYRYDHEVKIDEIINKMISCNLEVHLPCFTIETTTHFIQPFKQLGMRTIFDPTSANFSGIPGYDIDGLFISEIIQKVVVQVKDSIDEKIVPTVIAKDKRKRPQFKFATFGFSSSSGGNKKKEKKKRGPKGMIVDHPFIFYLVDKSNYNLILISGFVSNPNISIQTIHPNHKYKVHCPNISLKQHLKESHIC